MSTRIYKRNAAIEAASQTVGAWTTEAILAEFDRLREERDAKAAGLDFGDEEKPQ